MTAISAAICRRVYKGCNFCKGMPIHRASTVCRAYAAFLRRLSRASR